MARSLIKILSLAFLLCASLAHGAPDSFTYQGQIIRPNGLPLEAPSVTFTIEILSPGAEECLLYQEEQTINMQNSNGIFSLPVGNGTRIGSDYEDVTPLITALSNSTGMVTPTTCVAVGSYTPVLTDSRKLRLTFNDGTGPVTIDVDHDVLSVPYAANASSIDGLLTTDLIQVDTSTGYNLNQANLAFVFTDANWTELQALLNGSSASFSFATPTADVDFGNQKIINLATPTANNDAANKGYVDGNIGGAAADSAGIAALAGGADIGKSLNWNGTQWVAQAVDDTTKLSLDGSDTMAGNLAMGGNNITGANDVAVGNDLTVGNDAAVTGNVTVTGSISANGVSTGTTLALYNGANFMGFQAQAGSSDLIWQLPTADGGANQVLQTNGSGVLQWTTLPVDGLTSLNGETGATQTFANGATGTAPAFSSAANVHTLNIPLANGAGVTSGTISKTEFDDFNQKLDPTLTNGQIFVGNPGNVATGVAMSGDATMINTGAVTIANNAITSAKINDGEIVNADINASAAIAATKISAGNVDNTEFDYLDGVTSAIQTQLNGKVNDTGDTMTGQLYVDGGADEAQLRVDANGTQTGNILEVRSSAGTNLATVSSDGSITAATDLTTKNYVDTAISGISTDSIIDADSDTQIQVEESADEDIIRFDTAGTERMVINASGAIGIGTDNPDTLLEITGSLKLADGSESCSVAADGGMIRYNGSNLQYCNGAAWQTLGISGGISSLGGLSTSAQSFANGASGTAPNFASAGSTHTLNIPLASGAGVTSGTISKTDYDNFNGKLDAVAGETLANGSMWVGDGSNQAAAVAMSGDATMINTGAVTIANNAITSAKINDGEIVNADINASAGIASTKISAGNVDNTEFDYLDGVTSAIQTQLNGKVNDTGDTMTGQLYVDGGADEAQLRVDANSTQTGNILEVRSSAGTNLATVSSDGSISAATDLTTKNYVDTAISGIAQDAILDADSDTQIQVEESGDEDIIRFDTAGAERMTIGAAGMVSVAGTFKLADGGETCSVAGDAGMMRYNGGNLEYCNGTAWQTLGISGGLSSLGGLSTSAQSFANGASGTAPNFASAGSTHTLNIPLASGAGVTSGTISKTDYDNFNGKLDAVAGETLANGSMWVGDGSNQAAAVAMSGDATMINTGAVTIANNAITSTKINDGEIVDADINASAAIARSKFAAGNANRVVVNDGSGNMVDAAAITGNRALTSDANGIPVASSVTDTELGHVSGVTSAIQTQLNGKVNDSGDTMTGQLYVDGGTDEVQVRIDGTALQTANLFEIRNSGGTEQVVIAADGDVGIGVPSPSTILDIAGTIQVADGGESCSAGADGGMIRYNGGNLQFCNGSSWQTLGVSGSGLTSLGGQTGSSQTFATGATGTAPAFSSATNTHTLNIPLASGAGVTSGTISKTDYDNFNGKLDAVAGETLANGSMWVGDGSNQAAAVSMSGDATMINTGAVTIANNAITSAKINDGEIVNADINASAGIAAAKISAGNVDNTEFDYLDGVTSAIQTQLNGKVNDSGDTMTGQLYVDGGADEVQFQVDANGTQTGNIVQIRNSTGTNLATVSSDGSILAATDLTTKTYVDTAVAGAVGADSLDFTDFSDSMTLDASTDIAVTGTDVFSVTNSGTGNSFVVNDEAGDSTPFVITADGNVGIGLSAAPSYKLDVIGGIRTNNVLVSSSLLLSGGTPTQVGLYRPSADNLAFTTSATEQMRLDSSGNLGIGSTTPVAELDVAGTGAIAIARGTAAQRPGSPVNGMIRYNSDNNKFEAYENGAWANVISSASGDFMANGSVAMTGRFEGVTGSAAVPSIAFDGDETTGLYNGYGGAISFASGGTNTFTMDGGSFYGSGTGSPRMSVGAGIESAPAYNFLNDDDTGIYRAAADELGFSTAGTRRMVIKSSGNVGIGTSNPQTPLHVQGLIRATEVCDESGNNCVDLSKGWSSGGTAGAGYGTVGLGLSSGEVPWHYLSRNTNRGIVIKGLSNGHAAEILTNNNSGNTQGSWWTATHGGTDATTDQVTGRIGIYNDATSGGSSSDIDGGRITFATGKNNVLGERMRIDRDGNVGIGTTAPDAKLDVNGVAQVKTTTGGYLNLVRRDGTTASNEELGVIQAGSTDNDANHKMIRFVASNSHTTTDGGNYMTFGTVESGTNAVAERVRIDNTGNVGIGTTTPASKLHVEGEVRSTDSSGNNRLWGEGRPGTNYYGTSGAGAGLCTNGSVNFGLSYSAVAWHGAAAACPQGTWVCTAAERGTASCDTARPDHASNDATNCSGTFLNFSSNSHQGWVSDVGGFTNSGFMVTETGSTNNGLIPCNHFPVWCCSE